MFSKYWNRNRIANSISDSIFTWVPFQKFWNRWFLRIRIGIESLIPFSHEPALRGTSGYLRGSRRDLKGSRGDLGEQVGTWGGRGVTLMGIGGFEGVKSWPWWVEGGPEWVKGGPEGVQVRPEGVKGWSKGVEGGLREALGGPEGVEGGQGETWGGLMLHKCSMRWYDMITQWLRNDF